MTKMKHLLLVLLASAVASPAAAQLKVDVTAEGSEDMVIAVPVMPTPQPVSTAAGATDALGRQIAEVVANDLQGSGLFRPVGPSGVPTIGFSEVTAPQFDQWSGAGASRAARRHSPGGSART